MEKMNLHSPNFVEENIAKLAEIFPNCVTETKDNDGQPKKSIDFDLLKQELSAHVVEGETERYRLDWPGKRKSLFTANAPINMTLRPCRKESVNFDDTKNLFIEGDNLDALKLLQETYLGKVKMIYIDPPYNTGKDFIYKDNFAISTEDYLVASEQKDDDGNRLVANTDSNGRFHSDWLSMMYSRLKLARNLLKDDGVIFISIDDNEQANLKKMCDEIFGEDNFIANIVWQKRTSPDARRIISPGHEYILSYAKNSTLIDKIYNLLKLSDEDKEKYKNLDNDPNGPWVSTDCTAQAGHGTKDQFYDLITPIGRIVKLAQNVCWRYTQQRMAEEIHSGRIWFGIDGNGVPRKKTYLIDRKGKNLWTWWPNKEVGHTQESTKELAVLLGQSALFEYSKPLRLLSRIVQITSQQDSLILDFFAGSATTAHAVMQLNAEDGGNRQFIMVQLPEACDEKSEAFKAGYKTIAEISKERIRRAGTKIKEDMPLTTQNIDIGFRVLKIDSSNMKDVYYTPDALEQDQLALYINNIKAPLSQEDFENLPFHKQALARERNAEDLLFQVLVDWGVDLTLPIVKETIAVQEEFFEVFFVDNNALAACFISDGKITEDFCKILAERQPLRVVFQDTGFKNDSVKINVEQIFKQLSPQTEVKTI